MYFPGESARASLKRCPRKAVNAVRSSRSDFPGESARASLKQDKYLVRATCTPPVNFPGESARASLKQTHEIDRSKPC